MRDKSYEGGNSEIVLESMTICKNIFLASKFSVGQVWEESLKEFSVENISLGRSWKNSGIHLNINSTDNSRKGYLNDVCKKRRK